MQEDDRCCGSGTCIIDANGLCWCGQRWDGQAMCAPARAPSEPAQAGPSRAAPVVDAE